MGYLQRPPEDLLYLLPPDSRKWSRLAICLSLIAGTGLAAPSSEWEDAVLSEPPGPGWEFLWNCDSMSGTQDELWALRSRLHAVTDSGKAVRAGCATSYSSCSEQLSRLREKAATGKVVEDSLRERLGRLAAGCPAAGWARLVQFRALSTTRDSACANSSDSICTESIEWIAEAAWKATILSGKGEAPTLHALRRALLQLDPPRRDAAQLRLSILLDRRGSIDSARALRQTIISSAQDPYIRAAASLWQGVDSSVARDERARCLHLARADSNLPPRALMEIANLLESSDRPREAADTLVSWIRATESGRWSSEPLAHLARLTRKAGIHPDSFQVRLGAPRPRWADTLYLFQAREELRAGELGRGMSMLAGFHVRFPSSSLAPAARELLGKARRRDPEVLGSTK